MAASREKRLREIRDILSRFPSTQREIAEELFRRGFRVGLSTISRDLRDLGAVRVASRGGGAVYSLPGRLPPSPEGEEELARGLRGFLVRAEASGNLVVLHTGPGNAQALAALLDRASLREVAGTVAGDDTIIVVVREGFSAADLASRFRRLAGIEREVVT